MRRIAMIAALAALIAAVPATWASAQGASADRLEELVVDSADSPADHKALAGYYRAKAEDARAEAAHHEAMGHRYHGKGKGSQTGKSRQMKQHCDNLVKLNNDAAAEYDGLAKAHEAEAGE